MIRIETLDDALTAYFDACEDRGLVAVQPSPANCEQVADGWVIRNNGSDLAFVDDDGNVTDVPERYAEAVN